MAFQPPQRQQKVSREERTNEEFETLDYTPISVAAPVDMIEQLRPQRMGRRIKCLLIITCYNEEGDACRETLKGIASNMVLLEQAGLHWTEILVTCILDGAGSVSPSMYAYLQNALHIYDPAAMQETHEADGSTGTPTSRPVTVHVFERSVQLRRDGQLQEWHRPLQLACVIKAKNGGKLNSHLWMFNGFAAMLDPKYVMLFDVGTAPREGALLTLFEFLEDNPTCGGACGEITIRDVRHHCLLDSAQFFEYKVSHLLDKSFESALGYISVLPGAFSAYRWMAIRGAPLDTYFTMENMRVKDLSPFVANMFLAEDRILCFEIVARRHSIWTLQYVAGAVAETDCPQTLAELILQRRRWLNGGFFSSLFYLVGFPRFMTTDHSLLRKCGFCLQFVSQLSTMVLSWFMLGSLFLSLSLILFYMFDKLPLARNHLRWSWCFGYGVIICVQLLVGLVGKARSHSAVYATVQGAYTTLMFVALILGWVIVASSPLSAFVVLGVLASFFAYILAAVLHLELRGVLATWFQYYVSLPVFMVLFPIFSFCNLHDISWGTKCGNNQQLLLEGHEQDAKAALKRAKNAKDALEKMDVSALEILLQDNSVYVNGAHEGIATPQSTATSGKPRVPRVERQEGVKQMLREARRIAKEYRHDALLAQTAATELLLDKGRMSEVFNNFRMLMLSCWMMTNMIYVVVVLVYDPDLRVFATMVAGLIIYAVAFKLTGSVWYVLSRVWSCWARRMMPCLYRTERGADGRDRLVFGLRRSDFFAYDDLWVREHDAREEAEAELVAADGRGERRSVYDAGEVVGSGGKSLECEAHMTRKPSYFRSSTTVRGSISRLVQPVEEDARGTSQTPAVSTSHVTGSASGSCRFPTQAIVTRTVLSPGAGAFTRLVTVPPTEDAQTGTGHVYGPTRATDMMSPGVLRTTVSRGRRRSTWEVIPPPTQLRPHPIPVVVHRHEVAVSPRTSSHSPHSPASLAPAVRRGSSSPADPLQGSCVGGTSPSCIAVSMGLCPVHEEQEETGEGAYADVQSPSYVRTAGCVPVIAEEEKAKDGVHEDEHVSGRDLETVPRDTRATHASTLGGLT